MITESLLAMCSVCDITIIIIVVKFLTITCVVDQCFRILSKSSRSIILGQNVSIVNSQAHKCHDFYSQTLFSCVTVTKYYQLLVCVVVIKMFPSTQCSVYNSTSECYICR